MEDDLESGDRTYGENITYVAISSDGSIVAKFNPYGPSILIEKVTENDKTTIRFDKNEFFDNSTSIGGILGWSLAISNIIDNENDIGLVAISCITEKNMNSKEIKKVNPIKLYIKLQKQMLLNWPYFTGKQYQLFWTSSQGMTKLFKFSFKNNNDDNNNSIYKYNLGGVIFFLNNSKNLSNSATLVCMNLIKIQKIYIKLNINITAFEEDCYILPENLFKELESVKNAERNWKYLIKSRYQEFLMIDSTSDSKTIQSIELYNINTLQLVNVFHRRREDDDFLISRNNDPGIFTVTTDSRLF
ncbi:hypothetical protein C1645_873523, partial [Glomus cerebriforme]